jgi:hypothetical protein
LFARLGEAVPMGICRPRGAGTEVFSGRLLVDETQRNVAQRNQIKPYDPDLRHRDPLLWRQGKR